MKIKLNNIDIYYEKSGRGENLIMLHGNGEDHTIFNEAIAKLARYYTIYAIDSRNHGLSSSSQTISYDLMVEDLKEFIIKNNLAHAIVYGFSDGGIIALKLAIKYPDLISKIIISGANYHVRGLKLKTRIEIFYDYLRKHSQLDLMMLKEPHIKESDLAKIVIPVIIIVGENDVISLKHTKRMHKLIKNSQLFILKSENHDSYIIHKKALADLLLKYLA